MDLAFEVLSLYISPTEIPPMDLRSLVQRSYGTFRSSDITPLVTLNEKEGLHLLELFHGPTFAFKDVALQLLGNLFEYFLVRRNEGKTGKDRHHLTVIGATSGDTGSAAIYGLRGKKDVSVLILHPKGRVSPIQEAQMTTVLDPNVHNLAVEGTFDDCQVKTLPSLVSDLAYILTSHQPQDTVKALFTDPVINKTHNLAAVNSINWARILAQTTYYFYAYFSLIRSTPSFLPDSSKLRFVVPTGNFGDILAGYFVKRMGLPIEKLVVATNENDILHRFWQSGYYEKKPAHGRDIADGLPTHEDGVKETLSPAMDILVSSNFERLLWFLAYKVYGTETDIPKSRQTAGQDVRTWLSSLKTHGGFSVDPEILAAAQIDFESERVSDPETLATIKQFYRPSPTHGGSLPYILDPHTAVGVTASLRSISRHPPPDTHHISLATAHPAKFADAVKLALEGEEGFKFDEEVVPQELRGLEGRERRVRDVGAGVGVERWRQIVSEEVEGERKG
jgi:threonine synthase